MLPHVNEDLAALQPSGIRRFSALAASVPGCVRLTLGEPEFPTPAPVARAVAEALGRGETHYPPNAGTPELRRAISGYLTRQELAYGPEEVLVTVGATEALSSALLSVIDPGDEVVIPTPAFGLYETIVRSAHGKALPLDTRGSHFQIDEERLRSVVGPRTRAIVITSPNNPTGCAYDKPSLDAIARVASERGLCVVCDDVYNRLAYEPDLPRFARCHPELREQTVVVDSFSKPWAMTGWRLGWLACAPALMSQISKMHQYLVSCVPAFLQSAAVVALEYDPSAMVETYRRRRDLVCNRLDKIGLPLEVPKGAFYAFPDVSSLGLPSEELCERLIREAGVALVPGACFGAEGFARISFCVSDEDLECGLDRLEAWIGGRCHV